ncbi:MAG: glutathione S-transferase family protein, partial [Solirubrobacterales bacterium]
MDATLYVIPGSHPATTVALMLERKGIEYKRVDLMPLISKGVLKAMRFPGTTIPALKLDGRKLQGSGAIARELDRVVPEPPLFPADPEARAAVEQAEGWGEETVQPLARRVFWNAIRRDRGAMRSFAEGAKLGVPVGLAVRTAAPIVAGEIRLHGAGDENVRADLAALPGMLQRIDDWIAAGVLGGEQPNAADLQIATSLRLLMTLDDLRPAIESRPAGKLAVRVAPDYPGRVPPVLPPAWLESLPASA